MRNSIITICAVAFVALIAILPWTRYVTTNDGENFFHKSVAIFKSECDQSINFLRGLEVFFRKLNYKITYQVSDENTGAILVPSTKPCQYRRAIFQPDHVEILASGDINSEYIEYILTSEGVTYLNLNFMDVNELDSMFEHLSRYLEQSKIEFNTPSSL